jgi:hypothetical protein
MNKAELRSQYKSGERNFREQDFSGLDLSYFQLAGTDFSRSKFSRTNLRVADLVSVNFCDCDLTFAELGSADLTDANLKGANLKGANLQGATVTNIQYDAQTLFPIGFKPPGFVGLDLTPLRTNAPEPQIPQSNVAEDEPATIEMTPPQVPEISEAAESSKLSETPPASPVPPPASELAPPLPKGGSSSTTHTVIRGTTTGGDADPDPAYGIEDTFIRPEPLPDALSVPVIPIATHIPPDIPPVEPPPKPEPPTGVTRPVLPAEKGLPRSTFDPISEAKTVIPVAITPEAPRAAVITEPPQSDLPPPEQPKLPRPQGIAIPWTTILSIILLCALAVYYVKTEQLKGLEIFWLISVFVICTIPSFASHQNQPSFSNLVSAIGVPVLGIVNGFFYDGSLLKGWWVVFFLTIWLVVLSAQSKTQNNPKFSGDPKFVYLNNILVSLGFILNAAVLKLYVPVYEGHLMKFQANGTMIAFTLENMGQIFGLIGHVIGGLIFLLWSAFSFLYVTSIYSLDYDKKWFAKILTVLGLGVLGLLNFYLHPTNFMAGWWLVFVIGFILLVVNASIKVQNSQ